MNAAGLRFSGRVQLGLATGARPAHDRDDGTGPAARQHRLADPVRAARLGGRRHPRQPCSCGASRAGRPSPRSPATIATPGGTSLGPRPSPSSVVGVLYLGLATTSILVLGPAAGRSQAPLSDLMAIALGEQARVVTAVVAVLLTVGAMNAYFAGGSRLGAALATDGALPGWLAQGSGAGEVPRRSVAVIVGSSMLSLVVATVLDLGLTPLMLLATGCFTLVYVLGTASALRLLPAAARALVDGCDRLRERRRLLVATGCTPSGRWRSSVCRCSTSGGGPALRCHPEEAGLALVVLLHDAEVLHTEPAAHGLGRLVVGVGQGVDLGQPAVEAVLHDGRRRLGRVATAPRVGVQVPADLDLAVVVVGQRQQEDRADQATGLARRLADLDRPEAERRVLAPAVVAVDPGVRLVEVLHEHRLAVTQPRHDLEAALDVEEALGLVVGPRTDDQARCLEVHGATVARRTDRRHPDCRRGRSALAGAGRTTRRLCVSPPLCAGSPRDSTGPGTRG